MARKTDETKTNKKVHVMNLSFGEDFSTPKPVERTNRGTMESMVPFGDSNLFPQELSSLAFSTSLVSTIIDKTTKYVFGNGIELDESTPVRWKNNQEELEETIFGNIMDYISFGAFAIQVRRNTFGDIIKLDKVNVETLRTNELNSHFWYCKEWKKWFKVDAEIDAFTDNPGQTNSLMYYKNPMFNTVYGRAAWWSSLDDVVTMKALSEYGISTVNNAFCPSAVVSLVEGKPTEEEAHAVERDLNEKFCGVKNNAKLLVTFSDSKDSAPIIHEFNPSDMNAHYLSLKDATRDNIFAAFSVDPVLLGLRTTDGVFNKDNFEQVFKLYNTTEIIPMQKQIQKAYSKLGINFTFKPFKINWED